MPKKAVTTVLNRGDCCYRFFICGSVLAYVLNQRNFVISSSDKDKRWERKPILV